jgi:hypothetical protein
LGLGAGDSHAGPPLAWCARRHNRPWPIDSCRASPAMSGRYRAALPAEPEAMSATFGRSYKLAPAQKGDPPGAGHGKGPLPMQSKCSGAEQSSSSWRPGCPPGWPQSVPATTLDALTIIALKWATARRNVRDLPLAARRKLRRRVYDRYHARTARERPRPSPPPPPGAHIPTPAGHTLCKAKSRIHGPVRAVPVRRHLRLACSERKRPR